MWNTFRLYFLHLLPKNFISRIFGFLSEIPWPAIILNPCIFLFRKLYKIDMSEVTVKQFATFNEFFTRPMSAKSRPIDSQSQTIISPVDGVVGNFGAIENGRLFQAKGLEYTLEELVVREEYVKLFQGGYYLTLYLSPRHYHRIHSPVTANITSLYYLPGTLYPVNPFAIQRIPKIFARNERLLTLLSSSQLGKVAVVKVGATVVGKIKVVYDSITSNQICTPIYREYSNIKIDKGEELGRFQLGSTVILLFEKEKIQFKNFNQGKEYHYGETIGTIVL